MDALDINDKLNQSEKHFNQIGVEYRKLASYWLMATLGGLGFGLSHSNSLPINSFLFMALVAYAGCLGILVLWNMDIGVYQRLLDANFIEGLKLEEKFPELPQVRHNMMALHAGRGVQPRVNWFYNFPLLLLLIISTWCMHTYLNLITWQAWLLWLGTVILYVMFGYYIRNETTVNLKKKLQK